MAYGTEDAQTIIIGKLWLVDRGTTRRTRRKRSEFFTRIAAAHAILGMVAMRLTFALINKVRPEVDAAVLPIKHELA